MELQILATEPSPAPPDRDAFRRGLAALRSAIESGAGEAGPRFVALLDEFEAIAHPMRRALLGTPLSWSEDERREARWLHRTCDDLAALGHRVSSAMTRDLGAGGSQARDVVARTLFLMGETVKWDISVAPQAPHDMRKLHALMRVALHSDHHRDPIRLRVDGRECACTFESLYFRVLLLARFASGVLNNKQIEILDAWMWLWMPVLSGVPTPPPGAALRADLDSSGGLQRGPREDGGPSLYLPPGPIAEAYRSLLADFHAGRIVPAEGIASEFRIEEHIAVLDLIHNGLQQGKRPPVARAARRAVDRPVEIHIGLAEIMARGFARSAPIAASITLASVSGGSGPQRLRERDTAMGEIYDADRRIARLVDESDTGLGLEGSEADCASIAAGDLVAVRLSAEEPLVLAKVVRSVGAKCPGRVFLGLQRLTAGARLLEVRVEQASRRTETLPLLFVPGEDRCGRHDAWLVSERTFGEPARLIASADARDFTLRLNRARDRGRGWVLAGFEVLTARGSAEFEIA